MIGGIPYVYPGRGGQEGVSTEARRSGDLPEVNETADQVASRQRPIKLVVPCLLH